jgi:hypothetical protein
MNNEPPEQFDPEEVITVPHVNFSITVRPTTDGAVKAEIETWDPGDFKAMQHMMGVHNHRRRFDLVFPEQTPASVFDLLLNVAVGCASRVSQTTGTPWKKPLWLRALAWWQGVKNRDARQA